MACLDSFMPSCLYIFIGRFLLVKVNAGPPGG